ncbi:hypothetical protein D3C77_562360 [compost metagenome]
MALCKLALQQAEVLGEVARLQAGAGFGVDGGALEADGRMQHGVGFDDQRNDLRHAVLDHEVGVELRAMQLGAAVHAGGVQPGASGRRARVVFQHVVAVVVALVVREAGIGKADGGQV